MIYKTYKVYGRDPGNAKAKEKYLFTTSARNQKQAKEQGRRRVKGAYTVTRAERQW